MKMLRESLECELIGIVVRSTVAGCIVAFVLKMALPLLVFDYSLIANPIIIGLALIGCSVVLQTLLYSLYFALIVGIQRITKAPDTK